MASRLVLRRILPAFNYVSSALPHVTFIRFRSKKFVLAAQKRAEEGLEPLEEWAFNEIEKKNGLFKPVHTVEEQIEYMNSSEYHETYQGLPVYKWYRRNIIGGEKLQPPPRLFCIDTNGRFNLNHACPICRDEYLFFDFRNPALIEQFLVPSTDQPIELLRSNLCREQYINLKAQLLKAKEHGTITFSVEFRRFNYKDYYKNWTLSSALDNVENSEFLSRNNPEFESFYPSPSVMFETHNRDEGTGWDEWWVRHAKFAKTSK